MITLELQDTTGIPLYKQVYRQLRSRISENDKGIVVLFIYHQQDQYQEDQRQYTGAHIIHGVYGHISNYDFDCATKYGTEYRA